MEIRISKQLRQMKEQKQIGICMSLTKDKIESIAVNAVCAEIGKYDFPEETFRTKDKIPFVYGDILNVYRGFSLYIAKADGTKGIGSPKSAGEKARRF
ncbi:MAG: hypothetical protein LBT65_04390 [Synergistaceae bacterium]|jgi:hypothetical protein|nr:hypothetical protein [Synergistaceae bacterium]